MENTNIIKKITLNIDGNDVDVTPTQARDLYKALGDLLGLDKQPNTVKEYVPYYPPYLPQQVWPTTPFWYSNPTWCDSVTITGSADMVIQ